MGLILIIHLIALGIWIGVVGAEFAIEFDGMKDDESYIRASKLHYITDIWVEIPAFTTVLVTGLLMVNENYLSGVFLYKIIFALLAITFNVICVYAVFQRRKFALSLDLAGMKSAETVMKVGALIIPTFLVAFVLAFYSAW